MELICINSTYSEDYLKIFAKYNIKFPAIDDIVQLVGYEKLPRIGKTGLFVSPYNNQFIPGNIFGVEGMKEVSFDSKRFVTLNGDEVTTEMLKQFKQEQQQYVEQKPLNKEIWN